MAISILNTRISSRSIFNVVGEVNEKKKESLPFPPEILRIILNFLKPEDQLNCFLASKDFMEMAPYVIRDRMDEEQHMLIKKLKGFIDLLPEEERKKLRTLERFFFVDPYVAKLRNTLVKVNCIHVRFLRDKSKELVSSKIVPFIEFGLSLESKEAIRQGLSGITSLEDGYVYLCDNVLKKISKADVKALEFVNVLHKAVLQIENRGKQLEGLKKISRWFHVNGLLMDSADVARSSKECSLIAERLASISLDVGDRGHPIKAREMLKEALIFAVEIPDLDVRSRVIREISLGFQVWGDKDNAIASAEKIPNDSMRVQRLKDIISQN